MLNSLSGRFLILTVIFVMVAEVLIFLPSIARFREDYLMARLERAQIASLSVLADDMLDPELERELLENAGVFNVVLRRDEARQLALSSPVPGQVSADYDLRGVTALALIRDAVMVLTQPDNRIIRVIGNPVQDGGLSIEVTLETAPLRAAMLEYAWRILQLSAVISVITAALLFLAVRRDDFLCARAGRCPAHHHPQRVGARVARGRAGTGDVAGPIDRRAEAEGPSGAGRVRRGEDQP
jgi:hypothetical protein